MPPTNAYLSEAPAVVSDRSTRLVVLLHAYSVGPKQLSDVRSAVQEACGGDADIWVPKLPIGIFSRKDPVKIAEDLVDGISAAWAEKSRRGSPYQTVTLVGHSVGALLARKAYVIACGENPETPFRREGRSPERARPAAWAPAVDRLVLLAAMNRGWSMTHHLGLITAIVFGVGMVLMNVLSLLFPGRPFLIAEGRRGAPTLAELRLQWLSMRRNAEAKRVGSALVVQLLGTIDDMVSPEDNVDLICGRDFVYIDVPMSGHASIRKMSAATEEGRIRRKAFIQALCDPADDLKRASVPPADLLPQPPDADVTDVIFVIHGIRDEGYWTHRVARRIKEVGALSGRRFATETSSYGYFPMLPFILPWYRRRKVEWLMDEYTESKSLYPKARFHFVGHSNGTYLLARALEDYPSCRFENVVFAGSVVRRPYDWNAAINRGQVRAVLNYVATSDWVVAIFPKAFQRLTVFDIGSAGHDGFVAQHPDVHELRFVRGYHSAAITEHNWDAIAAFIVDGKVSIPQSLERHRRSAWLVAAGMVSFPILVGLVYAVVRGGFWVAAQAGPAEPVRTLAVLAYALLILLLVLRV